MVAVLSMACGGWLSGFDGCAETTAVDAASRGVVIWSGDRQLGLGEHFACSVVLLEHGLEVGWLVRIAPWCRAGSLCLRVSWLCFGLRWLRSSTRLCVMSEASDDLARAGVSIGFGCEVDLFEEALRETESKARRLHVRHFIHVRQLRVRSSLSLSSLTTHGFSAQTGVCGACGAIAGGLDVLRHGGFGQEKAVRLGTAKGLGSGLG